MKLLARLLLSFAAVLPLLDDAAAAQPPRHQHAIASSAAAPHVDGFDVEPVKQLAPGVELDFTLRGTPGAAATLGIDGAQHRLVLEETQFGVYQGTYTVSTRDRIAPDSRVTANLRLGNRVASAVLDDPLVAGTPRPASTPAGAAGPRIDAFDVRPVASLAGGNELAFTARGTPGAQASVQVPGARRFFLQETQPGVYGGSYTIRNADKLDAGAPVTLRLVAGDAAATTTLDRPLVAGASAAATAPHPHPQPRPVAAPARPTCENCATVVAVNPIQVKGPGSYVGPVAGGVVGALVGSQFGGGSGRTAAGIAGAVGGAFAGREIERRVNKATHYEVVVRLQGGGQQTFSYQSDPGLAVGTRVRVVDGRLVR